MSTDTKDSGFAVMINELLAKRALIDAAIANLVSLSGGTMPTLDSGMSPQGNGGLQPMELPRGAFLNKTLPEAVKLYLSAMKKKQTIREIATALKEGGVESTSPNFESVITGCLNRLKDKGDVLRFKDGWALAEFYPESLRSRLGQDATQKKGVAKKKKVKKAKKTATKAAAASSDKPAAPAVPSGEGLQQRIESRLRNRTGVIVSIPEILKAFPDAEPKSLPLLLGRLAKKHSWTKQGDGSYMT